MISNASIQPELYPVNRPEGDKVPQEYSSERKPFRGAFTKE